jgi:hypothetical protein
MGDSMSSVIISGDTSGAITLSAPAVAGTNTITLPALTGTVTLGGPAFQAYKSAGAGAQSVTSNVFTKVTFDTEEFDTNSNFASNRFTPTVAGYYQINTTCDVGVGGTTMLVCLYKNGSLYKYLGGIWYTPSDASNEINASGGIVVTANGSTDYFEIYVKLYGSTPLVYAGSAGTHFSGCFLRGL